MSDRLKSTLDVAMGRMKQMIGEEEKHLNDDQKRRIAEIRKEYDAKVVLKRKYYLRVLKNCLWNCWG